MTKKLKYIKPEMLIEEFQVVDVICTSANIGGGIEDVFEETDVDFDSDLWE